MRRHVRCDRCDRLIHMNAKGLHDIKCHHNPSVNSAPTPTPNPVLELTKRVSGEPRVKLNKGDKFLRLTATGEWKRRESDGRFIFKFVCDCGRDHWMRSSARNRTASCGCAKKESNARQAKINCAVINYHRMKVSNKD